MPPMLYVVKNNTYKYSLYNVLHGYKSGASPVYILHSSHNCPHDTVSDIVLGYLRAFAVLVSYVLGAA